MRFMLTRESRHECEYIIVQLGLSMTLSLLSSREIRARMLNSI